MSHRSLRLIFATCLVVAAVTLVFSEQIPYFPNVEECQGSNSLTCAYASAVSGNDLTGVVGDATKPFATLARAMNVTDKVVIVDTVLDSGLEVTARNLSVFGLLNGNATWDCGFKSFAVRVSLTVGNTVVAFSGITFTHCAYGTMLIQSTLSGNQNSSVFLDKVTLTENNGTTFAGMSISNAWVHTRNLSVLNNTALSWDFRDTRVITITGNSRVTMWEMTKIRANQVWSGGGLFATDSSQVDIAGDLLIEDNYSIQDSGRGAIYVQLGARMRLNGTSVFRNNAIRRGGYGGAVYAYASSNGPVRPRIEFYGSAVFQWNSAGFNGNGGAVAAEGNSQIIFYASALFDANISPGTNGWGGHLYLGDVAEMMFFGGASFAGGYARHGGVVYMDSNDDKGLLVFRSAQPVSFSNNTAQMSGGVMAMYYGVAIFESPTVFDANSAVTGGVFRMDGQNTVYLSNANFTNNVAKSPYESGGGAVSIVRGNFTCSGCRFDSNRVAGNGGFGGAVSAWDHPDITRVTLLSSTFVNNSAPKGFGGAICSSSRRLVISGCVFSGNFAEGGPTVFVRTGEAFVSFSIFRNTFSLSSAGAGLYLNTGTLTVTSSRFLNNSSPKGAAIHILGGNATLYDCYFGYNDANSAVGRAGAIYIEDGTVAISASTFEGNMLSESFVGGTALYFAGGRTTIENSTFVGNRGLRGNGTLYVTDSAAVRVIDCSFTDNMASYGGVVALASSSSSLLISRTAFVQNKAMSAGGTMVASVGASIVCSNCSIVENFSFGDGGVVFLEDAGSCPTVSLHNSVIRGNRANGGGGVAFFRSRLGCAISCLGCDIDGNVAPFGKIVASSPLRLLSFGETAAYPTSSLWTGGYELVDAYGQKVTSAVGSVTMSTPSTRVSVVLNNGTAVSRLGLLGSPGQALRVSASLDSDSSVASQVDVVLSGCPPGQGYDGASRSCVGCTSGATYSFLQSSSATCHGCPPAQQVICRHDNVKGRQGYWVYLNPSSGHAQVFECDANRCLDNGECADNRYGPLCGSCREGFSEWNGQCVACTGPNVGLIVGMVSILLVFVIFQHVLAQSSSGFFKIILNFVQAVSILTFPAPLFAGSELIDLALISPTTDACPFPRSAMFKMFLTILTPLGMAILLFVIYFIKVALSNSRLANFAIFRNRFVRSLGEKGAFLKTTVILAIGAFQSWCRVSFSFFTCKEIAGELLNVAEPSIHCDTDDYKRAAVFFAIILFTVSVGPFILLCILYNRRSLLLSGESEHRIKPFASMDSLPSPLALAVTPGSPVALNADQFQASDPSYGIIVLRAICSNYSDQAFFWECIVALRKLLLMALFTIFSAVPSLNFRRIALSYLFLAFAFLQMLRYPFMQKFHNMFENCALFLLVFIGVTVGSEDQETRNVLFVQILTAIFVGCAVIIRVVFVGQRVGGRLKRLRSSFRLRTSDSGLSSN